METFQEIAESENKEENQDASATAGLLGQLSVEGKEDEEKKDKKKKDEEKSEDKTAEQESASAEKESKTESEQKVEEPASSA